jgi:type I restriction enzyme R subunit
MAGPAKDYLALTQGNIDDKAVERAIDAFTDKQKREDFFGCFKELQTLYEILSPSKELADYIQDYRQLAMLYEIVRNAFAKKTTFLSDLAKKTENLIRESASYTGLTKTTKEFEINERSLAAIQQSDASDNNKVIKLIKAIQTSVSKKGALTPHLLSIAERADAIQEDFKDRQLSTRDALDKLEQLAREQIDAEEEKKRSGLDDTTFSLYWELKREGVANPKELAALLEAVFTRFPNYAVNPEELRQLKAELYKILLTVRQGAMMVALSDKLLKARGR